jgi:hypothetical protein
MAIISVEKYPIETQRILRDYGGWLLTHKEVSQIISDLTDYCRANTNESIKQHNTAMHEQRFGISAFNRESH